MSDDARTYVNPWGRTVPLPATSAEPLMFHGEPPEGSVIRLKVQCGSCYSVMSVVLEDDKGGLWARSTDRLREWEPGAGDDFGSPGDFWKSDETTPIASLDQWQCSGCRKATSPRCGRAYSWSLAEHRQALARARATRKPVTIRL